MARAPKFLFLATMEWEGYGQSVHRFLATGQEQAEKEAARLVRSKAFMPGGSLVSVVRAPRVTL
jgi:hypothetical protein